MYVSKKERDALLAAIDFISSNADGADEDKYPHDILDGLRSLIKKANSDLGRVNKKDIVKRALQIIKEMGIN